MLTGKQERFAQEVAKGSNYSDAYRKAYNTENMLEKSINEKASELMANVKVKSRVVNLRENALSHVNYDIEAHFRELEELRRLALVPRGDNGNIEINPAIKATELKGKLKGLYVDKKDITVSEFNLFTEKIKKKQKNIKDA